MELIKLDPLLLEFASEDLCNDMEVVMEAFKQDERTIVFASKSIRSTIV